MGLSPRQSAGERKNIQRHDYTRCEIGKLACRFPCFRFYMDVCDSTVSPAPDAFLVLGVAGLLEDQAEDPFDLVGVQADHVGLFADYRQEFRLAPRVPERAFPSLP